MDIILLSISCFVVKEALFVDVENIGFRLTSKTRPPVLYEILQITAGRLRGGEEIDGLPRAGEQIGRLSRLSRLGETP